jgi:hypothetical protein
MGSGAHPGSYLVGIGLRALPLSKHAGDEADHSPPSSVEVLTK